MIHYLRSIFLAARPKTLPAGIVAVFVEFSLDFGVILNSGNDDGVISVINGVCGSGAQLTAETALSGVILEKVSEHGRLCKVVDSNNFVTFCTKHLSECKTTDTAETINCYSYCHF